MRPFLDPLSNLSEVALCMLHRVYCKKQPNSLFDEAFIEMRRKLVLNEMLSRVHVDFLSDLHNLKEELNLKSYED